MNMKANTSSQIDKPSAGHGSIPPANLFLPFFQGVVPVLPPATQVGSDQNALQLPPLIFPRDIGLPLYSYTFYQHLLEPQNEQQYLPKASGAFPLQHTLSKESRYQEKNLKNSSKKIVNNLNTISKRSRTRLSEAQIRLLRSHIDLSTSPSDDEYQEISRISGLEMAVIKRWFRNTLFKERQRSHDSPYNFSVPPSTSLDMEEYTRSGCVRLLQSTDVDKQNVLNEEITKKQKNSISTLSSVYRSLTTISATSNHQTENHLGKAEFSEKTKTQTPESKKHNNSTISAPISPNYITTHLPRPSHNSFFGRKRPRTVFTPEQSYLLLEHLARNPTPLKQDIDELVSRLHVSRRVIQVWFQNARSRTRRGMLRKHSAELYSSQEMSKLAAGVANLSDWSIQMDNYSDLSMEPVDLSIKK